MTELLKAIKARHITSAVVTGFTAGAAVVLASFVVPVEVRATMQGSAPQVAILAALFAAQIRELREADKRHDERFARVERRLDRVCDATGADITGKHSVPPPEA